MGEIEKVNGALVGGLSINSAESTKNVSWSDPSKWKWHKIDELPDYIINEMVEQYLFPNRVFFSILKAPERISVNGIPATIEIEGWVAGDTGFTKFKLSKPLKAGDDQFKLSGQKMNFKDSIPNRLKPVAPDSPEVVKEQALKDKQLKGGNPLGCGAYLPQALQRILATVPSPEFFSSYIQQTANQDTGEIEQIVHVTTLNQSVCISIQATRKYKGKAGLAQVTLVEKLEQSVWDTEIAHGYFK